MGMKDKRYTEAHLLFLSYSHTTSLLCADHNDPHLPTLFCRETFSVSVHTLRSSTITNIFYIEWKYTQALTAFRILLLCARARASYTHVPMHTNKTFLLLYYYFLLVHGRHARRRPTNCMRMCMFFFLLFSSNQGRSLCHCYGFWLVALLYIGMHSAMHSDTIIIYIVVIVVT